MIGDQLTVSIDDNTNVVCEKIFNNFFFEMKQTVFVFSVFNSGESFHLHLSSLNHLFFYKIINLMITRLTFLDFT